MSDYRYVVMKVNAWDGFTPDPPAPFPIEVKGPPGSCGYLMVFEDAESAAKWAEGAEVTLVRTAQAEPGAGKGER